MPAMTDAAHAHGGVGLGLDAVVVAIAVAAVACYLAGVVLSQRRGRPWPVWRTALWCAGVAAGAAGAAGPLAAAAHDGFVAHMWAHLVGGMVAPLLLVLAAPVTLALRTLDVTPARRLSRLLRSAPARVLAHPVVAAALSAGGLWVLYLTPIFDAMRDQPLVHVLVHAHLVAAGALFYASVIGPDPRPHPPGRVLTAAVLVATIASHGILAKFLYANPPAGLAVADVRAGAQLMYYAGAWVEAVVIVIFCAQWYRAAGVTSSRASQRAGRLPERA
ncbi:cytochrome c oxidase assembly protein [Microbacterium sp. zg.Y1084]|uniref:cytochrome c oxidase assembly protein n=1 Tax=Microbacterium sp. zg.Y1084 TaxID=2969667 RepID=UPI00214AF084|nr:cytochrome c oxidase assembly protein [Microbacterium sp. zg.Y1084]MCR2812679.1 cytochrome c oxidase assembly protein [Microbacterium sp. zg.Y1084]